MPQRATGRAEWLWRGEFGGKSQRWAASLPLEFPQTVCTAAGRPRRLCAAADFSAKAKHSVGPPNRLGTRLQLRVGGQRARESAGNSGGALHHFYRQIACMPAAGRPLCALWLLAGHTASSGAQLGRLLIRRPHLLRAIWGATSALAPPPLHKRRPPAGVQWRLSVGRQRCGAIGDKSRHCAVQLRRTETAPQLTAGASRQTPEEAPEGTLARLWSCRTIADCTLCSLCVTSAWGQIVRPKSGGPRCPLQSAGQWNALTNGHHCWPVRVGGRKRRMILFEYLCATVRPVCLLLRPATVTVCQCDGPTA